jgi:hypothetical protein
VFHEGFFWGKSEKLKVESWNRATAKCAKYREWGKSGKSEIWRKAVSPLQGSYEGWGVLPRAFFLGRCRWAGMDRTVGAGGEEECDLTTEGMEFTEKKKGKQE